MSTVPHAWEPYPMVRALVRRAEESEQDRRGALFFQAALAAECTVADPAVALQLFIRAMAARPHHRPTLEAVARLAGDPTLSSDDLDGLVGYLDNPEVDERLKRELLLSRAERRAAQGDREAARDDVDLVLDADPDDRPARLLLQSIALESGDAAMLGDNLQAMARSTLDEDLRSASFYVAAKIAEDVHDKPGEAMDLLEYAIEVDPERPALHVAAARCARAVHDDGGLADRLERESRERTSTPGSVGAAVDAALAYHWRLDRPERAVEVLEAVLGELDGEQAKGLDALIAREVQVGAAREADPEAELAALRELGQKLGPGRRQAAVFTRIGQLMLETEGLGDIEGEMAVSYLESALDADSTYRPAMLLLDELYGEGRFPNKGRELLRRRGVEQGRADFLVKAAEMTLEGMGRADEAAVLLRQAIALSDDVLLFGPGSPFNRLLELIEEYPELAGLHQQAIEDALAVARTDYARRRLLDQLVLLAQDYEEVDPARLLTLTETNHLQLSDPYLADRLASLFVQRGRWVEYIAFRRSELDALEDYGSDRVMDAMYEIGQVHDVAIQDRKGALGWFRAIVDRDPDYRPAQAALEQVLIQTDGWGELTRFYESELSDEADQASVAFKLAMIAERTPGQSDLAARYYDQVLEADPNHLPSIMGAMRLAEAADDYSRWAELASAWANREVDDGLAAALHCEIGEILEERVGDLEAAAHSYRLAMERSPRIEVARVGLIRTLYTLELKAEAAEVAGYQLGHETQRGDPLADLQLMSGVTLLADDARPHIDNLLAEFPEYVPARLGALRHALAVRDVEASADHARHLGHLLPDGPLREAYLRLAMLLSRLAGHDMDRNTAYQMLEEGVADEQMLLRMEAWMRDNGDLEGLARIMQRHAGTVQDDLSRAAYLLAFGRGLQARGHTDEAIDVYEQILDERPGFLPAVKALKLLQEMIGDREGLAMSCEREGTLVKDQALAVNDFLTAGEIRRRYLGDIEGAIVALETVLKLEPTNELAFESLREIYSMRAQPRELYHLMQRRAEAVDDEAVCKDLMLRMAEIAFARLEDNELAKRCHQQVLELDPLHIQSYRILAELYEAEARWERAVDCLVGVLGLTEDKTLLALTYRKIADIYDNELEDTTRAIEAYRSLLRHDAGKLDALRRLAQLLHEAQRWEEAAKAYGSLLQRERSRKKLKGDLLALSRICLDGLGDPARAEQCLAHALRLDVSDTTLHQHLIDFYTERGETDKLAEHLTRSARQFGAMLLEDLEEGDPDKLQESLGGMHQMAEWAGERDRAFVVSAAGDFLGATNDAMAEAYETYKDAGALRLPNRPIPIDMTDTTIPPELNASVLNVLRYADEALRRINPLQLRDFGAGRRTRLSERDSRAGAETLNFWPSLFSLQDIQLHVTSDTPELPLAAPGDPAQLLVNEAGLERIADGDADFLFRLGRAVAPLSMGVGGFVILPEELLIAAFAAVVRSFSATYLLGDDRATHPHIDEDKIKKHMSRVPERLLIPHIYEITAKIDGNALLMQRQYLERAFCRLAMIPVFNPVPVLQLLKAEAGQELAMDGLTFVLQERYGDLRRAVGVALD